MQDIVFNSLPGIQALLAESSAVGIFIGENQTLDKVASGLAFYLALKESGRSVQIISKKTPIVEFSNLVGIDQIGHDFSGVTRMLTISVPYRNEEIEKVSYNIEGDRLNVNLFAEEKGISFTEQDVEYIKKGSSPSVVITIGTDSLSQVGLDASVKIINIDNSSLNSMFGDVPLVDLASSSISELITRIIEELNLPLDLDTAQNLLDGITASTQNFTSPKTSANAFTAAGLLIAKGARRTEIRENRPNIHQNLSQLVRNPNQNQNQQARRDRRDRGRGQVQRGNYTPIPQQNRPQPFTEDIAPMQQPAQESYTRLTQTTGPIPAPVINDDQTPVTNFIDTPESVPNDWFVPKVFKSTKPQE